MKNILFDTVPRSDVIQGVGCVVKQNYRFSTKDVVQTEQLAAFNSEFRALGKSSLPADISARDGFHAFCAGYELDDLRIMISESEAHTFSSLGPKNPAAINGEWVIITRLEGCAEVEIDGNQAHFCGNRVEIRRVGVAYKGRVSNNRSLSIFLPKDRLPGLEFLLERVARGERLASNNLLLGSYLRSLGHVLPMVMQSNASEVADATMAMICSSLSYDAKLVDTILPSAMIERYEKAKIYIDKNLNSSSLTIDNLASFLCVSRRQLYKLFEDQGGVHRYISNRRLCACFLTILRSSEKAKVAEVAEKFGFTNLARFRAAFKSQFGCTPTELQKMGLMRSGPTTFELWLKNNNIRQIA